MSARCKGCGAPILWGVTAMGRPIPLDPPEKRFTVLHEAEDGTLEVQYQDTYQTHFATCPDADSFRQEAPR